MKQTKIGNIQANITLSKVGFAEIELKAINALMKYSTYEQASKRVKIPASTLRQITFVLRNRYRVARQFCKEYEYLRKSLGPKKRYLSGVSEK